MERLRSWLELYLKAQLACHLPVGAAAELPVVNMQKTGVWLYTADASSAGQVRFTQISASI